MIASFHNIPISLNKF